MTPPVDECPPGPSPHGSATPSRQGASAHHPPSFQKSAKKRQYKWSEVPGQYYPGTSAPGTMPPTPESSPQPRSEDSTPRKGKGKKRDNPVKRWCFTLNNYTDEDLQHLKEVITEESCLYAIIGKEVGENETPHLQGFVNLKVKKRLSAMKTLISPRAHLERAMGSGAENEKYCGKDGDIYLTIGEPSYSGKRTDLESAVSMLRASKGDMREVADAFPCTYVRYGRGLNAWVDAARLQKPRDFKTNVQIWVGPPGCGKSRAAATLCPDPDEVFYKSRGEWWDGYNGQCNVIIDDFYGWVKHDEMLRICDRYPHRVPVKGAFVQFLAKNVYITSNIMPDVWYKFESYNPAALMRRINVFQVWNVVQSCFEEYNATPMYDPSVPYNY